VTALAVTKVDSADHIRLVSEVVGELEAERGMTVGSTKFTAMIETADAWFHMPEIAKADPRIVALTLGGEDFALSVGMLPTAEGLFMPKQQLAIAARAAGILPLGFIGTVADYKDLDAFRETIRRSRRLGFRGASVIHPAQVPILNEEFAPSADEVASARKIVAAYEEAVAAGRGSISVDGKMVDVPVVLRAQEVLAIHDAIRERERLLLARELDLGVRATAVVDGDHAAVVVGVAVGADAEHLGQRPGDAHQEAAVRARVGSRLRERGARAAVAVVPAFRREVATLR